MLALLETREKQSLEKALRREQRLAAVARREFADAARREEARTATKDEAERAAAQARAMDLSAEALAKVDNKAMQDFHDAARDQGLWRQREFKEGELSKTFNDEAGFVEGAQESGDDDEHAPGWKQRTEKRARGHRPRRGKGYGYRRDTK